MKNIHPFLTIGVLFMVLAVSKSLHPHHYISSTTNGKGIQGGEGGHKDPKNGGSKVELGMELYPTGSSLPDCSHACGPCFPCKRVIVSFKCSAESCPIVYRCMCKGKYYHVPSN
ncbi:hypothetical protein NMG60_11031477 [Bertholletia excelsa]